MIDRWCFLLTCITERHLDATKMSVVPLHHMTSAVIVRTLLDHSDRHSPDCKIKAQALISKLNTNLYTAVSKDLLGLFVDSYPRQLPAHLLPVLAPPHLRLLNLKQTCVLEEDVDMDCKNLKETLKKCSKLQCLELDGCKLGVPMALCDVITQHAPQLTSISFEGCSTVSDKFVQNLLKGLPNLNHLNLSVCSEVTDNVFALSETQGLLEGRGAAQDTGSGGCNLSSVDLSGNQQLTSTCIRHLTELCGPRLTCLNVSATQMDCTILWFLSGYSLSTAVQLAAEANKSILNDGSADGITLTQLITEFRILQERLKNIQDEECHMQGDGRGTEERVGQDEEENEMKNFAKGHRENGARAKEEQKKLVEAAGTSLRDEGCHEEVLVREDVGEGQLGCRGVRSEHQQDMTGGSHQISGLIEEDVQKQDVEMLQCEDHTTQVKHAAGEVGNIQIEDEGVDTRETSHDFPEKIRLELKDREKTTEDVQEDTSESDNNNDELGELLSDYVNDVIKNCKLTLSSERDSQGDHSNDLSTKSPDDDNIPNTSPVKINNVQSLCKCGNPVVEDKETPGGSWAKPRVRCLQCERVKESSRRDESHGSNLSEDNSLEEVSLELADGENIHVGSTLIGPNRNNSHENFSVAPITTTAVENHTSNVNLTPEDSSAFTEGVLNVHGCHSSCPTTDCSSTPVKSNSTETAKDVCNIRRADRTHDGASSESQGINSSTNERQYDNSTQLGSWRRLYTPCVTSLDIGSIDFDATLVVTCLKEFFVANKELKKLTVSWKELTDSMLDIVACGASQLQSLCLYDCSSLTSLGVAHLMSKCTNLKQLDVQGVCYIRDSALMPVFLQSNSSKLQSLKLSETNVSDSTLSRIARHLGRKITTLEVSWCEEIGDPGLAEIAAHCTALETLTLRQCPTSPSTLMSLAWNCPGLVTLNMSGVETLTDGVVQAMMPNLRLLKKLDVSWNSELTDVAISSVMSCCPLVIELYLMGLKRITEKPFMPLISELARWQRCKKLIKLKFNERILLRTLGADHYSSDEEYEDLVAPQRSTSYAPCLRVLELQYCDRVNDDLLAELVAICMGTLSIVDYYGMQIKPKLLHH